MKLQRTYQRSMYKVDGHGLCIMRHQGSASWEIRMLPATPDHEDAALDWWDRNQELYRHRFDSLREAREYLQALLAVDPYPDESQAILRAWEGGYEVHAVGEDGTLLRGLAARVPARRLWRLTTTDGHLAGLFLSLPQLRSEAGPRLALAGEKAR